MNVNAHHVSAQIRQQGTKALIFGFGFPGLFDYPLKQSKIKRPICVTGVCAVHLIEFQHQAEGDTHRFWHSLHLPGHQTQSSASISNKRASCFQFGYRAFCIGPDDVSELLQQVAAG